MTERPIIFSGPMVRAILEGRKTQTRRIIRAPKWSDPSRAGVDFPGPFHVGQILWVKETFLPWDASSGVEKYIYRATADIPAYDGSWKPSIYMPRKASRITLQITDVRIEHLTDITDEDSVAEGMNVIVNTSNAVLKAGILGTCIKGQRDMFRKYWDELNKKRGFGWDKNPWVWRIAFKWTQREIM